MSDLKCTKQEIYLRIEVFDTRSLYLTLKGLGVIIDIFLGYYNLVMLKKK